MSAKSIPYKIFSTTRYKRIRKQKGITACKHTNKRHYAKGMCNACYHIKGRSNGLATNCKHLNQKNYAKGMCINCYHDIYY